MSQPRHLPGLLLPAFLSTLLGASIGCGSEAPAPGLAPRVAGSTIPMAPPNAEGAGAEAVPQTWVSAGPGKGTRPGRGAPAAPGQHGAPQPPTPTEL